MKKEKRDVALILLHDDRKRLLLQHRTADAPRWPDYWGLFGGGLEENETPEEGLKREIFEELNYAVRNPRLFTSLYYEDDKYFGEKYYFIESYDTNQKLILNEGQDFKWVFLNEMSVLKIAPHNLDIIKKFEPILNTV